MTNSSQMNLKTPYDLLQEHAVGTTIERFLHPKKRVHDDDFLFLITIVPLDFATGLHH